LVAGDELHGRIFRHLSDTFGFKAKRIPKEKRDWPRVKANVHDAHGVIASDESVPNGPITNNRGLRRVAPHPRLFTLNRFAALPGRFPQLPPLSGLQVLQFGACLLRMVHP
jgi:hypothetical protein